MVEPGRCKNIDDVRDCIDSIDKLIISQLAKRALYVNRAPLFKKNIAEVQATDRVLAMIEKRRQWANEVDLNADFIQNLFENIVSFFIRKETSAWQKENSVKEMPGITAATIEDAKAILAMQKRAFVHEAELLGGDYNITPLTETMVEMLDAFTKNTILKASMQSKIVGSVRSYVENDICHIGRLIIEPVHHKNGYGSLLLNAIEEKNKGAKEYELFTGENSVENIRFYEKRRYVIKNKFEGTDGVSFVKMRKQNR